MLLLRSVPVLPDFFHLLLFSSGFLYFPKMLQSSYIDFVIREGKHCFKKICLITIKTTNFTLHRFIFVNSLLWL